MKAYLSTIVLGLGALSICAATVANFEIRVRMRSIGRKWVFLRGGTFNYGEYLAARTKHGWAAWPVYFMWTALVLGVLLIAFGAYLNAIGR